MEQTKPQLASCKAASGARRAQQTEVSTSTKASSQSELRHLESLHLGRPVHCFRLPGRSLGVSWGGQNPELPGVVRRGKTQWGAEPGMRLARADCCKVAGSEGKRLHQPPSHGVRHEGKRGTLRLPGCQAAIADPDEPQLSLS